MNVQQVRTSALIGVSLAVIAGGAAMALRQHSQRRYRAHRIYYPRVRDAGAANMKDPPKDWDDVDEAVDASFPASDPPCHCGPARFR